MPKIFTLACSRIELESSPREMRLWAPENFLPTLKNLHLSRLIWNLETWHQASTRLVSSISILIIELVGRNLPRENTMVVSSAYPISLDLIGRLIRGYMATKKRSGLSGESSGVPISPILYIQPFWWSMNADLWWIKSSTSMVKEDGALSWKTWE